MNHWLLLFQQRKLTKMRWNHQANYSLCPSKQQGWFVQTQMLKHLKAMETIKSNKNNQFKKKIEKWFLKKNLNLKNQLVYHKKQVLQVLIFLFFFSEIDFFLESFSYASSPCSFMFSELNDGFMSPRRAGYLFSPIGSRFTPTVCFKRKLKRIKEQKKKKWKN